MTCRQIVLHAIEFKVVHFGVHGHGHRAFGVAVSEEEAVFIGNTDGVRLIEGGRGGW